MTEIANYLKILQIEQTRRLVVKQGAFKRLYLVTKSERQQKTQEKNLQFIVRLDTYMLMLKYQAFFSIKNNMTSQ